MSRALQLKEEGNRLFQKGNYVGAESLYSQAIIEDPKNPALYTNRAMARLKLSLWDSVITDCQSVFALPVAGAGAPASHLKAHYYTSQARLAIDDPDGALSAGLAAHALCVATNDKSLAAVTAVVLRAKKARWERREKRRVRGEQSLEREMLELLRADVSAAAAAAAAAGEEVDETERAAMEEEAREKEERLMAVFERSRKLAGEGLREVPDWAIDDISFGFMVDPVMTKTGKSYERASIMEHLRRHPCDPLTREPLVASDLRPNMALRQACEDFLKDNGWAADW
ncbi:STIP1 y and U box-containing protein 1 [Beauveria bassiana]|uniref:U-box domain-containing protein n=2 Tax=Beauveria bassiana TaxID=176275 RepID=J5J9H7_BEAB2|nr:U-box domain-containing protein [Beauveria bassiana ARSEF 2860]EJP62928.1 U-box domain-containing protein [Beauveria bassiana ARSEF 2860]KAF1738556.1 STIP1 y and U box-containing protein 1 [Beauveria bassiana]KAH8720969.1 STIP1 y and U box-containing protein 1 [Beauveria bassiana]